MSFLAIKSLAIITSWLQSQYILYEIHFESFIPFYKNKSAIESPDLIQFWSKREFSDQLFQSLQIEFSPTLQMFVH